MRGMAGKKALIVLLIVAVVAAGAYAAVKVMLPKSARFLYMRAEAAAIKGYTDSIKEAYRNAYDEKNKNAEGITGINTEVSVGIKPGNVGGLDEVKQFLEILEKLSITVEGKYDPAGQRTLADFSLNLDEVPVVAGRYIQDGSMVYLNVPAFLKDNYIKADTGKPQEIMQNLGIEAADEVYSIIGNKDAVEPLKPSEFNAALDNSMKNAGSSLVEKIAEEDIQFGKTDDAEAALGSGIKKVHVTFDEEKTKSMLSAITGAAVRHETLKAPGSILALYVPFYSLKEETTDEFKEFIDSIVFTEGLSMELLIDSSNRIVSRKVSFAFRPEEEDSSAKVDISVRRNKPDTSAFADGEAVIKLTGNEDGEQQVLALSMKSTQQEANGEGGRKIVSAMLSDEMTVDAVIDTVVQNGDGSGDMSSHTNFDVTVNSSGNENKVTGTMDMKRTADEKRRIYKTELDIMAGIDMLESNTQGTVITLGIDRENMLDIGEFELPAVDAQKTYDLNSISEEDLEKLKNGLLMSLGMFLISNGLVPMQ